MGENMSDNNEWNPENAADEIDIALIAITNTRVCGVRNALRLLEEAEALVERLHTIAIGSHDADRRQRARCAFGNAHMRLLRRRDAYTLRYGDRGLAAPSAPLLAQRALQEWNKAPYEDEETIIFRTASAWGLVDSKNNALPWVRPIVLRALRKVATVESA